MSYYQDICFDSQQVHVLQRKAECMVVLLIDDRGVLFLK